MKSTSIGTRAASASKHPDAKALRGGFTLMEALVALSLLVAFGGVLGPFMFQGRGIVISGSSKVRAEMLLRSLLQSPFNRLAPELGVRDGEDSGLRWRIEVEPATDEVFSSDVAAAGAQTPSVHNWTLFHVTAEVSWGAGKMVKADTLRLGAPD